MTADVCLVLEGSYPFARGGVSEWAHTLIQRLPDLTFHLWCLVPDRTAQPAYEPPPNVVGMTRVHLFEEPLAYTDAPAPGPEFWRVIGRLHAARGDLEARARLVWDELPRVLPRGTDGGLPLEAMLLGRDAYQQLLQFYGNRSSSLSFIDYHYTFIYTHLPLFKLLGQRIPPARVYHAISTGYAGFLAAWARRRTGNPLVLTEHGIYTNERQVEIILARWIHSRPEERIRIGRSGESLKRIWMDLFAFLGQLTYRESDAITSLFGGNAVLQEQLGADARKIEILPNGVDRVRFAPRTGPRPPGPPVVGLVGRVVAIKDIRTFIRACRGVADRLPEARFRVMGPWDPEDAYVKKCLEYRRLLGLDDRLEFTGPLDVTREYPKLDAVVLTSVSEALPLTVLEAMACGVPLVTTRVGACEELLDGRPGEDRALGSAGLHADVGDHAGLAQAIVRVLEDSTLAAAMGRVGQERVRRFYDLPDIVARYRALYARHLAAPRAAAGGR